MNHREREHEERLQAEAESAERQQLPASQDPLVNEYRLVLRALRREPSAGLPADFAARIARRVLFSEERGSMEDWLVTALMLVLAVGGAIYALPLLSAVMSGLLPRVSLALPELPWPLLGAAAVAVAVAWVLDRGLAEQNWTQKWGRG